VADNITAKKDQDGSVSIRFSSVERIGGDG
jgi:hypothetical protein